MNILTEDFLSIEEVAIYLERFGYKFDLEKQHEYSRLYSKIYDLTNQKQIAALFYYCGTVDREVSYFEMGEDNNQPITIPLYEEWNSKYVDNFFYISRNLLRDILIYEKNITINGRIQEYGADIADQDQDQDVCYHLADSIQICLKDIRIPKCELDSLFQEDISTTSNILNNTNSMGVPSIIKGNPKSNEELHHELNAAKATIEQQKQEIGSLANQLEQTHTSTDISKKEGQGDSLLILGAVMHCIKDAAKKNYTQELLTQTILTKYKSISGISESTLKKKYSEAKGYLEQRLTPQ